MPKSSSIDPIVAANLKAVLHRKRRSAYSVAKALGYSANWLYGVINMNKGIMLPTLREVAEELGVPVGSLFDTPSGNGTGEYPSPSDSTRAIAKEAYEASDYAASERRPVEVLEVASAAGVGAEVFDETPVGLLWFRNDWLDRHAIDAKRCNIISVQGDSMEPTLPDGCSILVDRKRREPHEGLIYVMRTEEGLVVKRLGKDEKGRWLVVSDNPDWPAAPLLYGTDIIGEVRWLGRTF